MISKGKFDGKHSDITDKILAASYQVYTELGYGFSEKISESALEILLKEMGFSVERQKDIFVYYHGQIIGVYTADLIVNGLVLLELKSVSEIIDAHMSQLLHYLKATEIEVGYVMNFGPEAKFRRGVFDNARKGSLSWTKPPQKETIKKESVKSV